MRKIKTLFFGCGFLASHLIPQIIPLLDEAILVDYERVENVNYDNYILPKGMTNKLKTIAFSAMLQLFSNIPVAVYNKRITRSEQLRRLVERHNPEIMIVTVDNIEARRIAFNVAEETKIETLYLGVTAGFGYVDWHPHIILPRQEEEEKVREVMRRIRDVCTRLEFRPLGALVSSLASTAIFTYVMLNRKIGYIAYVEGGKVMVVSYER